MAPESLLVYFKCTQINLQAHGYRSSFHLRVFQSIVFIHRKTMVKKLIIHLHVSTN
jgi:hypothetical protein